MTLRGILRLLMPAEIYRQMELESRDWYFTCEACGNEFTVWDSGGIRYKASGNPVRLVRCPACRTRAMMKLRRRSEESR